MKRIVLPARATLRLGLECRDRRSSKQRFIPFVQFEKMVKMLKCGETCMSTTCRHKQDNMHNLHLRILSTPLIRTVCTRGIATLNRTDPCVFVHVNLRTICNPKPVTNRRKVNVQPFDRLTYTEIKNRRAVLMFFAF